LIVKAVWVMDEGKKYMSVKTIAIKQKKQSESR
jgi:hypothetical protein